MHEKSPKNEKLLEKVQKRLILERHHRNKGELKEALKELQSACAEREKLYQRRQHHSDMLKLILKERHDLLIALDNFPKYTQNLQDENDTRAHIAKLRDAAMAIVNERKANAEERVAAAKVALKPRLRTCPAA